MTPTSKCAAAIVAAGALTLTSAVAHAATCDATGLPGTVVYIAGSSAAKPMLKNVSKTLATQSSPIRIIYISLGSCAGLSDITTNTKESTTGTYWDETNNNAEQSCTEPSGGATVDVAVSDVFPSSCTNITLQTNQKDFQGSTQVFSFVVPASSKQTVISQEAAFVVYGFGGTTNIVDTWNDPNYIFKRDPTKSGTYSMLAKLLALDPSKMKGTIPGAGKTPDVLNAVYAADAQKPDAAIGVLSQDYADANRVGSSSSTPVKILAYQDKGAACGFYPDSAKGTFDKLNVRTGLYPFWGPIHFITNVTNNVPTKTEVATLLSFFTRQGLDAANKKAMIDNEVAAFTVPQCAMKVSRTAEVSPALAITPYDSPEPCGCYYEYKATGATSCTQCTDNGPCGSGVCRYGYCEAK
jgi:ABC-type phosphate transport system substrate-binding protein